MKVVCYASPYGGGSGNKRAVTIARAFAEGAKRRGHEVVVKATYDGVEGDIAVAYGWVNEPIFTAYKQAGGTYFYWDLGYWGQRDSTEGHHRVGVGSWDTADNMARHCSAHRFEKLGVPILPKRPNEGYVIIAGMSEKAGGTHGWRHNEFEQKIAAEIHGLAPGIEVIMRPKPSRVEKRIVMSINDQLAGARLLVTHHSNCALDALAAGVPCFALKGVGRRASPTMLSTAFLEQPRWLEDRRRILYDAAYMQWTPEEMRQGLAWDHLKGLIGCA